MNGRLLFSEHVTSTPQLLFACYPDQRQLTECCGDSEGRLNSRNWNTTLHEPSAITKEHKTHPETLTRLGMGYLAVVETR